jgi:hypothetical protein
MKYNLKKKTIKTVPADRADFRRLKLKDLRQSALSAGKLSLLKIKKKILSLYIIK